MIESHTQPHASNRRRSAHSPIILLIGLIVFTLYPGIVRSQTSAKTSQGVTQNLVQQGVALYEQKDLAGAHKALIQAEVLFPNNYAVPYYLGLIHLSNGQRADAISQWERYLRLDPDSENAMRIRKLLTLLQCEEATDKAKKALANEARSKGPKTEENALAITPFQNMGSQNLKPLGNGMAAMLIADLSEVPGLHVVGRIELQAMLQELKLGASGLIEVQAAPKLGRLLKVKRVSTGSFADLEAGQLEIAGITIDTDAKEVTGSQNARGSLNHFFDLEKQIACGILTSIGEDCKTAPKDFHRVHTKSLPAFVAFSEGLNYFDQRQYNDARKKFQQALQEDPAFDLAREALGDTPLGPMQSWDTAQMVSSASANGIPSAAASSATAGFAIAGTAGAGSVSAGASTASTIAAGTATADSTIAGRATTTTTSADTATTDSATAGTTTTASTTAGTTTEDDKGLSTTTMVIAGGAVAVGGILALAGGGGGGGGGGDTNSAGGQAVQNLTGDWSGDWNDSSSSASGLISLRLTQDENRLVGSASFSSSDCLSSASISGTISGQTVSMDLSFNTGSGRFEGTFSRPSMSGTVRFTTGECEGRVYEVSCELLSSADVTW